MVDIQVRNLTKFFVIGENLLDNLSFEIQEGERVAILGRNGCGKTTLFNILTGQMDYDSGEVYVNPNKRLGLISQIPKFPAGYTVEDVLRTAYAAWREKYAGLHGCAHYYPDDYYAFALANDSWLNDYALYMALKTANGMKSWTEWPREYRLRDAAALAKFAAEQEEEIGFWKFLQYEFATQWKKVKDYANAKGVKILGDIPIYVSADSVDAWVGGELFELDAQGGFARVAGCPPDYFSADGQLWGNPLYNWPYHKQTGYVWWVRRVRHALGIYDLLRIDHFRGFDTYWAIPAGSPTACTGKWEIGPRMDLFHALEAALGKLPIIAEDLGELFPSVRELLADSTFPGMKVLQFAFGGGDNEYLPHNYVKNSVVYPGTHDNTTLTDWWENAATGKEKANAAAYLHLTPCKPTAKEVAAVKPDANAVRSVNAALAAEFARVTNPAKK